MAPLIEQVIATVPTWLRAQGTTIVTAGGDPVRLQSVNWYGAEENDFVVGGLTFSRTRPSYNGSSCLASTPGEGI